MAVVLVLCACQRSGQPPADPQARYSYALGVELAERLRPQKDQIDLSEVQRGLADSLSQSPPMTLEQAQQAVHDYAISHGQQVAASQQAVAERNLAAGKAFLAENGKKPGVVTLPSGLQYQVLVQSTGSKPGPTDQVGLRFRGTRLDGTVFDSTDQLSTPLVVNISAAIPGWREILPMMGVGSKYRVFLPGPLAFGDAGLGQKVEPQEAVIYEVELLSIMR